jgi:hypothetical protein
MNHKNKNQNQVPHFYGICTQDTTNHSHLQFWQPPHTHQPHHCHVYSSIPQYFSWDEYEETLPQQKAFQLHQLMEP